MCEASLYPWSPFETLSYGFSLVLPAFTAETAQGPHVGRHCSLRPKDNDVFWLDEEKGKGKDGQGRNGMGREE